MQDAIRPVIEEYVYFHDYLIVVLVFIITGVSYYIRGLMLRQDYLRSLFERQLLEAI